LFAPLLHFRCLNRRLESESIFSMPGGHPFALKAHSPDTGTSITVSMKSSPDFPASGTACNAG